MGLLEGRPRALLLVHDNPDPDAIAAALCLSVLVEARLDVKPRIAYGGVIGRAENRNMVRALDIPLWSVDNIKFRSDDAVILVDTQPGFANNSLPADQPVLAVVDHHPGHVSAEVPLADVRPSYGAVTTIVVEYLVAARVPVAPELATAICYAIATETQDLGREASVPDIAAYLEVFPLCDQPLLGRLRHPRRDMAFFVELDRAIRAARVSDGVAVCHMGTVRTPDSAAEMADVLASIEGLEWVMCTGVYEDRLIVSVRTLDRDAAAGELLRGVVGERRRAGGHGMIAGGAVEVAPGEDPQQVHDDLARRFLAALGRDAGAELKPLTALAQPVGPEGIGSTGGGGGW